MQTYESNSSSPNAVEQTVKPTLVDNRLLADTSKRRYPFQTRIYTGDLPHQRGNCFATAIGCLMGIDDPETIFQVQEQYDHNQIDDPENWAYQLLTWLNERGWDLKEIAGHQYDDSIYMVSGESSRGRTHVCLYQNGKLLHDPYPGGCKLLTESLFMVLLPLADG